MLREENTPSAEREEQRTVEEDQVQQRMRQFLCIHVFHTSINHVLVCVCVLHCLVLTLCVFVCLLPGTTFFVAS